MWRTLSVLVALTVTCILSLACSSPLPKVNVPQSEDVSTLFVLHVDTLFNSVDRAIVLDSFMEWERDTKGVVKFALDGESWNSGKLERGTEKCTHEVYVASVKSTDKEVREVEDAKSSKRGGRFTVLGYTQSTCNVRYIALVIDRLKNPVLLRNVTVHEVGHLIGLDHIPVPNESVMFPSMDKAANCPTKLDMKQFCSMYSCKWQDMISCDD